MVLSETRKWAKICSGGGKNCSGGAKIFARASRAHAQIISYFAPPQPILVVRPCIMVQGFVLHLYSKDSICRPGSQPSAPSQLFLAGGGGSIDGAGGSISGGAVSSRQSSSCRSAAAAAPLLPPRPALIVSSEIGPKSSWAFPPHPQSSLSSSTAVGAAGVISSSSSSGSSSSSLSSHLSSVLHRSQSEGNLLNPLKERICTDNLCWTYIMYCSYTVFTFE